MTNKQTIDGVPRELLERALRELLDWEAADEFASVKRTHDELRALLDKPDTPYVPKGDWSFDYIAGGDIVIRHGKDWTLIKRGSGPIYEQFLYRFCEEQMKPAAQPQGEPVACVEIGADRNAALTITDDNWLRTLKDRGAHQLVPLYAEQPAPVAMTIPDECPHIIVFDDADREQLVFAGAGARSAAQKTWEQISGSWNAHLFVRIERNSRDNRYPSAL